MVPLHIDLSEIIDEFSLTEEQYQELGGEIINRIVTEYTMRWENLVNRGLKKTRKLYKNAMYVDRVNTTEVVFGLSAGDNGLAIALEEGKEPFDLKEGFKHSSKVKKTLEGGWYLTIPFRYATLGAVAESMIFQERLPKDIYNLAKNNGGKALKKSQLPSQYAQLGQRKELITSNGIIPAYTHKSPKYQGLVRLDVSSTKDEKRGGYFTFRRVSNKSDVLSWIHPGFEAKKFMDKALSEAQIDLVAEVALNNFLKQIV